MKYITSISLLLLIFFSSCKGEKNNLKYITETNNFNTYLKENFVDGIPKDSAYYLLICEFGCGGCISTSFNYFSNIKKTKIIMSQGTAKQYFPSLIIKHSESVLFDTSDRINRLPYHQGNVAVIGTSNNRIDTIVAFEASTIKQNIKRFK